MYNILLLMAHVPKGFSSLLIVLRRSEHSTLTNVLFKRKKECHYREIYCHFLWLLQQKKEMKAIREKKYDVWILLRHNLILLYSSLPIILYFALYLTHRKTIYFI